MFNWQFKAATIVAGLIMVGALCAAIVNLPALWAIDLLKTLTGGAAAWLLIDHANKKGDTQ
jgi:hypothetical protein